MKAETAKQQVTFQIPGREPIVGKIKNGQATLGSVMGKLAKKLNIAGTCEVLDPAGNALSLDTPLQDLPDEVTIGSELTPA